MQKANKSQALIINYTKLNNRKLYFDGDSTVSPQFMWDFLLSGKKFEDHNIFPRKITPDIRKYNNLFDHNLELKENVHEYDYSWNIPKKFQNININNFIMKKLEDELCSNDFTDDEMKDRIKRTKHELCLWNENNMYNLLKTLIHIVDEFQKKDIVWGTGRGSSCCCYVLYLIGIHDVDSILYDLDLKEFFR